MFYPEKRDGYSRIGKIKTENLVLNTPTLLEFNGKPELQVDFGKAPYALRFISETLYERLKPIEKEISVLTGLNVLSPRQILQAFEEKRSTKPLYAVAAATTSNVALLFYLGADIVDNILAIAKAYSGLYFVGDIEMNVFKLKKFPCSCQYCKSRSLNDLSRDEIYEIAAGHNTEMLKLEVEKCRHLIEREELRNYVEAKVKLHPEMTAVLRVADSYGDKKYFSRFKKSRCHFSAMESANRFEVSYFLNRALECYKPVTDTVLLLPCTARKPYLTSRTHRHIRSRVRINVNEIIISSPLVVPREFELTYPAINYDTPVTGHWSEDEIAFVASWLRRFIEKGGFRKVVAHVEGGYRKVVERALENLQIEVVYTVEDGILGEGSMERLREEVAGLKGFDLYERIFDHMLRYQFDIEYRNCRYSGKYPEIEMLKGKERVARVDVRYGMLDIYEKIARILLDKGIYTVKIADFDFTNTIFAAGVLEADENIRPNDVVVFTSNSILGVGIAAMSGGEMVESEKGIAVRVKRKYPV
ncbi:MULTISPECIES: archaeosine synthase subunit alpha [unclassified Archaeoglobus]|mgnify:CR=1 FL=1|jgi:archaeosine synthase|uniref:archaeosine synthase subunit alpha n=1 Tax=unclassified Archaeoglobus TaxID=2643606 RepID=UPI0025C19543|nr:MULTISPECIES: archaeosine synthase subunit alpha [unclassified Archaeoglobus]